MKFMNIFDLEAGDLVEINSRFLAEHYNSLYQRMKSKYLYIIDINKYEEHKYIKICLSNEMSSYSLGEISIYDFEILGDYPIKIIELGND